ncbi:putative ubiquitin thioesterase otu1 [Yarrowia sp. C11]|nr:putative ubiquitin thioesterase otu1 [Yarrowia sp. E02]KAG5369544.1 putative ubiquitin thioesterase otu1 [Yarrowia sp. C11]
MKLKLRTPTLTKVVELDNDATVEELSAMVLSLGVVDFSIKGGFPPKPVDLSQGTKTLASVGIQNGDQLIVSTSSGGITKGNDIVSVNRGHRDPIMGGFNKGSSGGSSVGGSSVGPSSDLVTAPCGSKKLVLRVMEDDNSCMFRAVGYNMMKDADTMFELRMMVKDRIAADPETYSDAILGRPRNEYMSWITRQDAWGGAIELQILAENLGLTIISADVSTGRLDHFNPGKPTFCIVVYSGIHYDSVALAEGSDLYTNTSDVTVFSQDAQGAAVLESLKVLMAELKKKHYYTDTSSFAVKCNDCGSTFTGEKGALEHARMTGHQNFGES